MRLLLRLITIVLCYLFLQESYHEVRTSITRAENHRSSVLRTVYDYALRTNAFSVQTMADFFACALRCLGDSRCMSVNFHRVTGLCEMSTDSIDGQVEECTRLYYREGSVFGQLVNVPGLQPEVKKPDCKDCAFVFTTLGAKGRSGPNNTHGYNGTNLEGSVTLDKGMQLWRVPQTAEYSIQAYGASGANGTCNNDSEVCHRGGLGARIIGSFHLVKDTMLTILVGQQGQLTDSYIEPGAGGGGGGGSFVVSTESTDQQLPLVVAGGGGGGGTPLKGLQDGDPGQEMENGSRCGGFDGKGGRFCNSPGLRILAGSGAGFYGDGVYFPAYYQSAKRFSSGGLGGEGPSSKSEGGFGGGGYGMEHGGGGGGYSGGGIFGAYNEGTAGGGGSFNSGSSQENTTGINYGDGRVTITML